MAHLPVQTIPGKGPQALQRGHKIVAAFGGGDPAAAAAATAASNAAGELHRAQLKCIFPRAQHLSESLYGLAYHLSLSMRPEIGSYLSNTRSLPFHASALVSDSATGSRGVTLVGTTRSVDLQSCWGPIHFHVSAVRLCNALVMELRKGCGVNLSIII